MREAELREIRHEDDIKIYQRDPNKVKALAERMVEGRSPRKKLLDKVAPMWTEERRRA